MLHACAVNSDTCGVARSASEADFECIFHLDIGGKRASVSCKMIWSLSVPCDKSDWRRGWDRGGREEEMEGITISIFGLDRVRREREGKEETSGEEGRPMIDIELIRIIVGGGGGEDCKGLKINKNGGWESGEGWSRARRSDYAPG